MNEKTMRQHFGDWFDFINPQMKILPRVPDKNTVKTHIKSLDSVQCLDGGAAESVTKKAKPDIPLRQLGRALLCCHDNNKI